MQRSLENQAHGERASSDQAQKSTPTREEVEHQLEQILSSPAFRSAERPSRFLRYVVEETLAGRHRAIKGYTVAVNVFDRPADFDPAQDPVVRIEAGRLRRRLDSYYMRGGVNDPVRIDIPQRTYVPVFSVTVKMSP